MIEDNWVKYAKMDLQVAKRELYMSENTEEIPTPIVCFHSQQAVEKALKAYLIKNNESVVQYIDRAFPCNTENKSVVVMATQIRRVISTMCFN